MGLFPTAVLIEDNQGIYEEIPEFEIETNFGNTATVSKNVLESLPLLKEYIQNKVNEYAANIISPLSNVEFYITHSWINYTKQGEFHHLHDHPNSIISGVYYLQADPIYDKIVFHNPSANKPCIKLNQEYNDFNCDTHWIPVINNRLVLFPSTLKHEVPVSDNPKERISLAFNVFVKGEIGLSGNTDNFIL